jgi:hypothetical protein
MEHTLKKLVLPVLALAAVIVAFVGVSAALERDDSSTPTESTTIPEADCTGSSTSTDGSADATSDDVACEDTSTDDTTTDDTTTDDTTTDDTLPEDDGPEDEGDADAPESGGRPENHGAAVSEAAHTCPPGPEHGPCVSEVARNKAGEPDDGEDDGDELSDSDDTAVSPGPEKGGRGKGRGGR